MADLYKELQGVAAGLLHQDALGQPGIVLISMIPQSGGTIDDPKPNKEERHEIKGGAARGASFRYVTKGLAKASDTQVTLPVVPGVPAPVGERDFIEVNGERFKIVGVDRKPQAGTVVAYTVIARR